VRARLARARVCSTVAMGWEAIHQCVRRTAKTESEVVPLYRPYRCTGTSVLVLIGQLLHVS
jgi:hypothetical protein